MTVARAVLAFVGLAAVGLVNPLLGACALGLLAWRFWFAPRQPPPPETTAPREPARTEPSGAPWFRPEPPPGSVLGPRRISKTSS